MQTIVELFKKQRPQYKGQLLTLDDVEIICPIENQLLFTEYDEFKFKARHGSLGYGIYFTTSLSKAVEQNDGISNLFNIVGCNIQKSNITYDHCEYCIDVQPVPCCIIYMSLRSY